MNGIHFMFLATLIGLSTETYQFNSERHHKNNLIIKLGNRTASVPKVNESMESRRRNYGEKDLDKDYKELETKWKILTSSSEVNKTLQYIPQSWLVETNKQNVTFNASQARPEVAGKLDSLIKKHKILYQSKNIDEVSRDPISKDKPSKQSISKSLKDRSTDIKQKISNNGKAKKSEKSMNTSNEYPAKNETARNLLFEEWKLYYECLKNNAGFVPKAHYAFPGETINMICQTCPRPGGETRIEWSVSTSRTGHKEIEFDPSKRKTVFNSNNRVSIQDNGLSFYIFGVNEKDAGNYSCRVSKAMMSLHLLQVASANENITKVWPEKRQKKQKAALAITLPNFGLTVFTRWKSWTACSRCSHVGKRFKVGVCMIKAANGTNNNAFKVLSLFKEGIPCRSKLLPQAIQNHPNVASRNSEIMESYCKEPCPKAGKFIVRDEKGQVVEEADNARGVFSMLQRLPSLHPPTQRKLMFLKQWDTAHIQCPGNSFNDIPTRWFINNQPIYAKGDRIYVTPSHILVVEDLGLSDSNLYSCWQGSRLVGTVRLIVTEPVQRLAFTQQIGAISMIMIVLTLVLIFLRAFSNAFLNDK